MIFLTIITVFEGVESAIIFVCGFNFDFSLGLRFYDTFLVQVLTNSPISHMHAVTFTVIARLFLIPSCWINYL